MGGAYFHWYSLGLGVGVALCFGIVCEIFFDVFRNHSAVGHLCRPLFRWTTIACLVVALCSAVYSHRSDVDPNWFAVHVLGRSANIVLCGLILAIFLYSAYLGLSWSRCVFGMALGLGILCSVELATTALRSQIGSSNDVALDILGMATYHACVVIWLVYLLLPERRPIQTVGKLPEHDLDVWNTELQQLLHQ